VEFTIGAVILAHIFIANFCILLNRMLTLLKDTKWQQCLVFWYQPFCMVPRGIFFASKNCKKISYSLFHSQKRHEIVDFTLVNIFDYIYLHWDPFGSGSESKWFDRIRILQNVRILSDLDLDSDSDPQHWLGSLHCKYL